MSEYTTLSFQANSEMISDIDDRMEEESIRNRSTFLRKAVKEYIGDE